MMENPRVLGALRVSVNSDDSTSAEKQEAAIDHWAKGPAIAGSIVGWARDLDVSGGMDPFKRPDLGPWLTERADEWDVLAVHRLDRLTRRSAHFAHLYEWCGKTSKTLVSVTEGIDMSTPMGKMFAQIIAAFAEGELDTIRARALSGSLARMTKGTWIGGVEPFGYRFTQVEDGGKKLVQDPEYVELFWNIVEDIRNDKSSYRIAVDLNKRGILTWRDRLRVLKGKEPRGIRWTSNTVRAVLQNEALTGRLRYKGEVVDDEDGNPVMVTEEPIMRSYGEWSDLVIKMQTERPSRTAVPSRSMLGGVPTCGSCGSRMSSGKKSRPGATRVYHYYACNAKQTGTCDLPASVRSDDLEMAVNLFIESSIGHLPVYERQGNSISQIKASLEDALSRLETLENKYLAEIMTARGSKSHISACTRSCLKGSHVPGKSLRRLKVPR